MTDVYAVPRWTVRRRDLASEVTLGAIAILKGTHCFSRGANLESSFLGFALALARSQVLVGFLTSCAALVIAAAMLLRQAASTPHVDVLPRPFDEARSSSSEGRVSNLLR